MRAARAAIEARGRFKGVPSGGSTPRLIYATLGVEDVEWGKVHVFFADERCVSPDRHESNHKMAQESFLLRAQVPPENVHRIEGEMMGAKEAVARRAIQGAPNGVEAPARRIDPAGGRVLWLLDRLAATKLETRT